MASSPSDNHTLLGNFNIPSNIIPPPPSSELKESIHESNFTLNNNYLIHEAGNNLELIISHSNSNVIHHTLRPLFSDHYLIFLTLNLPNQVVPKSFRIYNNISTSYFTHNFKLITHNSGKSLKDILSSTFDTHASLITKQVIISLV